MHHRYLIFDWTNWCWPGYVCHYYWNYKCFLQPLKTLHGHYFLWEFCFFSWCTHILLWTVLLPGSQCFCSSCSMLSSASIYTQNTTILTDDSVRYYTAHTHPTDFHSTHNLQLNACIINFLFFNTFQKSSFSAGCNVTQIHYTQVHKILF